MCDERLPSSATLLLSPLLIGSKLTFSGCYVQNAFWHSGNNSRCFFSHFFLQNTLIARETPFPFMANAIINLFFDFWNLSLSSHSRAWKFLLIALHHINTKENIFCNFFSISHISQHSHQRWIKYPSQQGSNHSTRSSVS